jgi:predicted DCC family thiol-disulfide oxidoreductase YuxK
MTALRSTPQGKHVVLYDGHCRFCTAGARQLRALARPGALELLSFQDPGVLVCFPGLSYDECMKQMYLITPDGRRYGGFEAAVRAVATRPLIGWLAYVYYLPGLRQMLDWLYRRVAANRYRLLGRRVAAGECDGSTCKLHFPAVPPNRPPAGK